MRSKSKDLNRFRLLRHATRKTFIKDIRERPSVKCTNTPRESRALAACWKPTSDVRAATRQLTYNMTVTRSKKLHEHCSANRYV